MSKCVLCLHSLPIFNELPFEEFKDICIKASKDSLKKGDFLFHQGQTSDTVYLIKEGSVKLVQFSEDGKEIILNIIGSGQVLGETALFKQQTHYCNAIAMETVNICSFSLKQFEELIKIRPNLALSIITNLGQKLYETMRQLGDSANHTVENKLLALLFRLSDEYGKETDDGLLIQLNLTQEVMANMIGSSRVMVAQVLMQFKKQGFLSKKGKYYIMHDKCITMHFRENDQISHSSTI